VHTSIVRRGALVDGEGDYGWVPFLTKIARTGGVSGYIGDGSNRWPAVHRFDAARLYPAREFPARIGVPRDRDEGVATRDIAEVIGRRVPVVSIAPEDAGEHFDWMAAFWSLDVAASSALTRERLVWNPAHIGLIRDLEEGHYFQEAAIAAAWTTTSFGSLDDGDVADVVLESHLLERRVLRRVVPPV